MGKFSETSKITIYETQDGKARIEVKFEHENVWLTQKLMADLFECTTDNISLHLYNIYESRELSKEATTEEFSVVQVEGKRQIKRKILFYSLEAIIAVGYRVNSAPVNGWHIKKITDIYATAVDYSLNTVEAEKFFATVQNKLHFAITGQTAAEVIASRADRKKPYMGLMTWCKSPTGKILPQDIKIAKNYLQKKELESLNRIVAMYIDYAEFQASRGRPMYMRDWSEKLDAFLKFNEQDILQGKGKVSHEAAIAFAEKQYEIFRVDQDKKYMSDFDKVVKNIARGKEKKDK